MSTRCRSYQCQRRPMFKWRMPITLRITAAASILGSRQPPRLSEFRPGYPRRNRCVEKGHVGSNRGVSPAHSVFSPVRQFSGPLLMRGVSYSRYVSIPRYVSMKGALAAPFFVPLGGGSAASPQREAKSRQLRRRLANFPATAGVARPDIVPMASALTRFRRPSASFLRLRFPWAASNWPAAPARHGARPVIPWFLGWSSERSTWRWAHDQAGVRRRRDYRPVRRPRQPHHTSALLAQIV